MKYSIGENLQMVADSRNPPEKFTILAVNVGSYVLISGQNTPFTLDASLVDDPAKWELYGGTTTAGSAHIAGAIEANYSSQFRNAELPITIQNPTASDILEILFGVQNDDSVPQALSVKVMLTDAGGKKVLATWGPTFVPALNGDTARVTFPASIFTGPGVYSLDISLLVNNFKVQQITKQFSVAGAVGGWANMVLFQTHVEPLNASYQGKAQKAKFTFASGPEQLDFVNNFFVDKYINETKNAVKSQSPIDDLLMIKVYRDTTPVFQTNYMIEITATDRTGNPLPWLLIIGVALALIIVWLIIRPTLQAVTDLVYGPPGSSGSSVASNIPWIVIAVIGVLVIPNLFNKGVQHGSIN